MFTKMSSSTSSSTTSSSDVSLSSDFEDIENLLEGSVKTFFPKINIIGSYNDYDFKRRFRFSKSTVLKICSLVEKNLEVSTERGNPIPPINQLLLCLRFYATNSFQLVVGDMYTVSQATVSRIIKNVSKALASLRPGIIQLPAGSELPIIKQNFYEIKRFPGVIGLIDCTHIKITSVGGEHAEIYRNRKSFYSINAQVVCDYSLKIRDVVARWPGSTHDSRIYDNSLVKARLESGEISGYLLGDSGYACSSFLLTPILNPINEPQRKYNEAHKTTRITIERCFGVLKRRFPVLSNGIRTSTTTSLTIIVACCVLHNIAIEEKDDFIDCENNEEHLSHNEIDTTPITAGSFFVRNQIITNHFST